MMAPAERASRWRVPPESIFSGRPLDRGERVAIAILVAVAAGLAAYLAFQKVPDMMGRDFTYPWRGARALLAGQDPYAVIRPSGPPPYDMWFMYPLTAAMAVLPLALLSPQFGGALFVALGSGLLVYVISRRGIGQLWMLLSVPFAMATVLAQWSPLLIAGALAAPLGWALACKPTIGAALFAYRPSWRTAIVAGAFIGLAFLIQPNWFQSWLHAAGTVQGHRPIILQPFGWIPLIALLRWRRPEARLVAVMALVPQNLYFYDQLPLWLVATSGATALAMTVLSWAAWVGTQAHCELGFYCGPEAVPWIVGLVYLPATAFVLFDRSSVSRIKSFLSGRIR